MVVQVKMVGHSPLIHFIKEVMTCMGEVVFSRNVFVKLVLSVTRSGEGYDNEIGVEEDKKKSLNIFDSYLKKMINNGTAV